MKKILSLLFVAALCMPAMQAKIKVHTIGDSTMADYDENATDKRGWCTYLGSFFNSEYVEVNNKGKSGADTRRFYTSNNLWPSVKEQMKEGDYLIIQFAHNDEGTVTYGMDNLEYAAYCEANGLPALTDDRGTNPQTTYRDMLRSFIDEARALGVTPILAGPICRKYFSGNTISRKGQHDLGDKFWKLEDGKLYKDVSVPADDNSMDYVYAMQVVAKEKEVPFIDMTAATRDLYLEYGEAQCTDLLFCKGDNTHTATLGANLIARLGAQLMKDAGILAEYINIPTSISASPTSLSIGEVYSGVEQSREVLLTGFGLEPASGTVSIAASENLKVSIDKENFASTVNAAYEGATLFQRIYVRALYKGTGEQEDKLTITSGEHTIEVPVSATVISLEGGAAVKAVWPLDADKVPSLPLPAVCEGPVAGNMTVNHMVPYSVVQDVTIDGNSVANVVRFHNADEQGAKTNWPTDEIDENAIRYVDFSLTAPTAMDVRITKISMYIGAYSTSAMKCHINTGLGDDFAGVTTIYEAAEVALPNKSMNFIDLTPTLNIPAGETLHIRVLPWHEHSSGSGKYILLKDVTIEGRAFDPAEAIEQVESCNRTMKVLRDGQLFIIRDGKTYTAQGVEIY